MGCFHGDNAVQILQISNRVNSAGYIKLLQDGLNANGHVQFNYIRQQYNAPIHKTKGVMAWFQRQGLTVMP